MIMMHRLLSVQPRVTVVELEAGRLMVAKAAVALISASGVTHYYIKQLRRHQECHT